MQHSCCVVLTDEQLCFTVCTAEQLFNGRILNVVVCTEECTFNVRTCNYTMCTLNWQYIILIDEWLYNI
jgi:hypothetical protein